MVKRFTAFVDPSSAIVQGFIDEFNNELDQAQKITYSVLQNFLKELSTKSASTLLSQYKIETQKVPQKVTVKNKNYLFQFWRMRFLPPGGESAWNIINTLSAGRKGMPKREEPYVLNRPGIIQGRVLGGGGEEWRQIQRQPATTSANSISVNRVGNTEDHLFTQGPIRSVPARNFYPHLLSLCQIALKAKGLNQIELEIIQEG